MPRLKRTAIVLMLTLLLSLTVGLAARVEAAAGPACNPNNVYGMCFDTLPRLYCCSPAFLGWSGIYVGDRFPVSGKLAGGTQSGSLTVIYPSGRSAELPITGGDSFRGTVSFDEEGRYALQFTGPQGDLMKREFYVAYQVRGVDQTPTISNLFGADHGAFGNLVLAVKPSQRSVRVQFTDGAGKPARSQTLAYQHAGAPIKTDADGIAELALDLEKGPVSYPLDRAYPGLVIESFREIAVGADGTVAGMPGGDLAGQKVDGVWYFGLREFLAKADPWAFPADREWIHWDGDLRTVSFDRLRLMADTGEVLGARSAMRVHLTNRDGRLYVPLADLARLFDQIGYAQLSDTGVLRIGFPFTP